MKLYTSIFNSPRSKILKKTEIEPWEIIVEPGRVTLMPIITPDPFLEVKTLPHLLFNNTRSTGYVRGSIKDVLMSQVKQGVF